REVARALGYVVTIEEFRPFRVGSRVGGRLYDEPWHHAWQITAPNTHMTYFRAGQSRVGERLRAWGNQALECRINQLKPAHTVVIFAYRDGQEVLLLADGTPLLLTDGEGGLLLAQQTVN
ncbi:putative phage tail protein, partial [Cutibacterium acnes]